MLSKTLFTLLSMVLLLVLPYQLSQAAIVKEDCGPATFIVDIINGNNPATRYFKFYYQAAKNDNKPQLFYQTTPGNYFFTACIKNKIYDSLFLFQQVNGYDDGPNDRYGLFDSKTKAMLINPDDWPTGNTQQVQQLIGHHPPFVYGYSRPFFCCFD